MSHGLRHASDQLLSVVLPVYNERGVLAALTAEVEAACRETHLAYEIIFVDDGSRDGSGLALDELATRSPHVRVVHLSRNFGHQAALQAGLAEARGDAVVLMDADLQDAPSAIPAFVQRWREGVDVVYAIRTHRKEGPLKRACFTAFYRLLAAVAERPLPLDAGNFGLIDRRVVELILSMDERDRYFPGLRHWVGFSQAGVEVERAARYDGRPRVSTRGLLRLAKAAMFSFSTLPLTLFYAIGFAALAIFVGLSGFAVGCKLFTNLAIPGWTSHILSASFFGALNALGISILGEYAVRIYDQVRRRPLYVVARRVGSVARSDATDAAASECEGILNETQALLAVSRAALAEAAPPLATTPPPDDKVRKPKSRAKVSAKAKTAKRPAR